MYSVHISNGRSKLARSKENAPQEVGDQEMVARGGIEPPTQGFSEPLLAKIPYFEAYF
jgi:hypothetical protein